MKKGDRVMVYGNLGTQGTFPKRNYDYYSMGNKATITQVVYDQEVWVRFDKCKGVISGHEALVHAKQCRKLKRKV